MGGNLRICQAILEMTNDVQNAVIFMILKKKKKGKTYTQHPNWEKEIIMHHNFTLFKISKNV